MSTVDAHERAVEQGERVHAPELLSAKKTRIPFGVRTLRHRACGEQAAPAADAAPGAGTRLLGGISEPAPMS